MDLATDKKLSRSERAVLLALAYHANKNTGKAWPGVDTLAERSGYSRAKVYEALPKLETLLDHVKRPGWTTLWRFPADARSYPQGVRNPEGWGVQNLDGWGSRGPDSGLHSGPDSGLHSCPDSGPEQENKMNPTRDGCQQCGGSGFVVVDSRRRVCTNRAAHR